MATLQEVDAGIKELAAKIKSLKESGTADPATVKQLVVSYGKGLSRLHTRKSSTASKRTAAVSCSAQAGQPSL